MSSPAVCSGSLSQPLCVLDTLDSSIHQGVFRKHRLGADAARPCGRRWGGWCSPAPDVVRYRVIPPSPNLVYCHPWLRLARSRARRY